MGLRDRWRASMEAGAERHHDRASRLRSAWDDPPRHVVWHVGEQTARHELFGPDGLVLMSVAPGSALLDASGARLVRFRRALLGPEASKMRVTDATGITIAEVAVDRRSDCEVRLLPPGTISDRIAEQTLGAERLDHLRDVSPLRHHLEDPGGSTLGDARGVVLARERSEDLNDLLDRSGRKLRPWSIEVADNYLPAAWLFALIHACAGLRGAFGRHN